MSPPRRRWRLLRTQAAIRGADVASASRTPLRRGVSDDGGTCAIGSVTGGASGSSRRGALGDIHTHIRRGGCSQRLYALVTASGLCRTNGVLAFTSPDGAVRDGGGLYVIGSTIGSACRNITNGSGGSGARRGVFVSIHVYIRGGGCGQHPGSGCGRHRDVIRNTPANAREEGRYAPGSGRVGCNRIRIRVNRHANAGRGGRSRRGTGDGIHSCIKGGGGGQDRDGGGDRCRRIVGSERGHRRETGSRAASSASVLVRASYSG